MEKILSKLNDYIFLIEEAQEKDNYAENRSLFKSHLSEAAKMYAHLIKSNNINSITQLVLDENRNHGISFMPGAYGEKISIYWSDFVKASNISVKVKLNE